MAVLIWNARKVAHGKITATEEEIEAAWKRREERNKIWKGKIENEKA